MPEIQACKNEYTRHEPLAAITTHSVPQINSHAILKQRQALDERTMMEIPIIKH